jgi:hypothetical protein
MMKFAFGINESKPIALPIVHRHHIATPEIAVDSCVLLLREKAPSIPRIYKRLEHEVYKILSIDGFLRDGVDQPQISINITQAVMPIALSAYAHALTNHFDVLSVDEYGRDVSTTADRIFMSVCTAFVLRDLRLISVNPRWDPAVVAQHLVDTDTDNDKLDRATVIKHISTAARWAAYLCMACDAIHIAEPYLSEHPKEEAEAPILDERKVARFVSDVERKLVQYKTTDPKPLNLFRRMIDGEIHGPRLVFQ